MENLTEIQSKNNLKKNTGKEPEEIEKDVKDNIDDMENEYYIHGRSRNH